MGPKHGEARITRQPYRCAEGAEQREVGSGWQGVQAATLIHDGDREKIDWRGDGAPELGNHGMHCANNWALLSKSSQALKLLHVFS